MPQRSRLLKIAQKLMVVMQEVYVYHAFGNLKIRKIIHFHSKTGFDWLLILWIHHHWLIGLKEQSQPIFESKCMAFKVQKSW